MAKAIMIQGTMSNAGKSLITAGLCRIFKQDGYRVAPFKSQNMALNSFVTKEGLEMGRAQVVQAEAAKIEPIVAMNPILLKPTTDIGSQVIVNGVAIGHMSAREYFQYKKQLWPEIKKAYEQLDRQYDIIVIEGAGSPAEINLKQEDIVNMGMAKLAKASVLLVGDIDRGGVFAQLYGTVMLLEPEERALIKGLIINKFRGDKSLLDSGITMMEELCHIPVVGVTPYVSVQIEEEDSMSEQIAIHDGHNLVDIAVIRFPKISNYTDFQVFSGMEHVALRYVGSIKELGNPDLIILPGSKNTIQDLLWMRQCGLESAILKMASKEIPVIGICGGYQMLGMALSDGMGVAGAASLETMNGMGLLPIRTDYHPEKRKTRVGGVFAKLDGIFHDLSGRELKGYEIHMGESTLVSAAEQQWDQKSHSFSYLHQDSVSATSPRADGCCCQHIYGTYVHGVFDQAGVTEVIINALLDKKGYHWANAQSFDYAAYKETQYDVLADQLRTHLDLDSIYQMLAL